MKIPQSIKGEFPTHLKELHATVLCVLHLLLDLVLQIQGAALQVAAHALAIDGCGRLPGHQTLSPFREQVEFVPFLQPAIPAQSSDIILVGCDSNGPPYIPSVLWF